MGLSLESMAIEMPAVFGHPNRVAFRGVLTVVDVPSDRAPAGARGHRVMLKKTAAEAAIPSLLGMALDYSPRFDAHDARRKIGVITRAEIAGGEIAVAGFLYGRDFPEIVAEIGRPGRLDTRCADKSVRTTQANAGSIVDGTRANGGGAPGARAVLGMSYEIADAVVEDTKATIWVLTRVTFTGAAVLRRDKAAYSSTWITLG